jgi:hypothetical protein
VSMIECGVQHPGETFRLRRLTHAEARAEERMHWHGKTMAERLAAMWELNSRMAAWRGVNIDERQARWTIRRVSHRGR